MGPNHFEKKYQKVPIKIGMRIAIAIGFVFLIFFIGGGASPPNEKKQKKCVIACQAWLASQANICLAVFFLDRPPGKHLPGIVAPGKAFDSLLKRGRGSFR